MIPVSVGRENAGQPETFLSNGFKDTFGICRIDGKTSSGLFINKQICIVVVHHWHYCDMDIWKNRILGWFAVRFGALCARSLVKRKPNS
mmetsp:Transcript_70290/g.187284  ORF Transcript_70290/g.187284 Transcript_70290/m.187284 type:complete len:89 (-) Transcript_70290:72-338(-)